MDIPMSWLKEYANVTTDIKNFIEDITMTGSKVEGYTTMGGDIENVVTGKIKKIVKHPDADKLVITTVDIGKSTDLTIVTGATNLKEGDYVPVALDNSKLAGGVKIHSGNLRGVTSEGMLCSIQELGFDLHDFGENKNADIIAKLNKTTFDSIIQGKITFHRAFMTGDITAKGDFRSLRMLDELFSF